MNITIMDIKMQRKKTYENKKKRKNEEKTK